MNTYNCKIRLVADYLQARFSDKSKNELEVKSGKKAKVKDTDSWEALMYKDEKGIYIPAMQIKGALINGGKSIKKKPHGNFKNDVRAYMFVSPEKIYIGKQKPDFINESYPKRQMDGTRVKLLHPAFKSGLEVNFKLNCTNDEIDEKTIKVIVEKAGLEYGIGAWRPEHGRFEVVEIK